mgnify:CR=1 FL=1
MTSGAGGCERNLPRQGIRTYSQDGDCDHASVQFIFNERSIFRVKD